MHPSLALTLASLLVASAAAAPLARIDAPAPGGSAEDWAEALGPAVDLDEGMGTAAALVPSFDVEARAGSLVAVGKTAGGEVLMRREGEAVLAVHEVDAEGVRLSLVFWKSLTEPGVLRPELWSADGSPVWGNLARVTWQDARVEVRAQDEGWSVRVSRSLTGENQSEPRLPKRERYRITARGLELEAQRYARPDTPEQRLNLIADLGTQGRWAPMVAQVKELPRTSPVYLQRAAIVLSRFPAGPAARGKSRLLLETMASHSSRQEIVVAAADRLLEMAWEESATQEGPTR